MLGELMTVGVANMDGAIKLQYITRDGQNYVGAWTKGKFQFWVREPFLKHENHVVQKDIDPKIVSFIVLKNRDSRSTPTTPDLGSLELNNGDHLPVAIMTNPILLTNGWSDRKLKPEDILEICFDGGLHGTVMDAGGPVDLTFMYIKDKYLTVQIPRNQNMVKIPWDQVAYIQGHNGGFRQELTAGRKAAEHSVFYDNQSLPPREIGTVWIGALDDVPDQIGIKGGSLLTNASGATAIPASAVSELDLLGNEEMIAIEALFDDEDDEQWHMDIAIEDMAAQDEKDDRNAFAFTKADQEELEEDLLFASMENEEADPEEFIVPEIDEDFAALLDQQLHLDEDVKSAKDEEEQGNAQANEKIVLSPQDMAALEEIMTDNEEEDKDFSVTTLDDILKYFQVQPKDEEETAMVVDMPEPIIIRDFQDEDSKHDEVKAVHEDKSINQEPSDEPAEKTGNKEEHQEPVKAGDEEIAFEDQPTMADTQEEPHYIWKEEKETYELPKDEEPGHIWTEEKESTETKAEEPHYIWKEEKETYELPKDEEPGHIWTKEKESTETKAEEPSHILIEEKETNELPKTEEPGHIWKEEKESTETKAEEPDYIWKEDQQPIETGKLDEEHPRKEKYAEHALTLLDEIEDESSGDPATKQNTDDAKGQDFLWEDNDDDSLSPDEAAFVDELLADEETVASANVTPDKNDQMAYVKEQLVSLPNDNEILLEQYAAFLPFAGAPALLLKTDPYYISLNPVSNRQYETFVVTTGRQPACPFAWNLKIADGQENAPVVNISYQDAEAYAAWKEQRASYDDRMENGEERRFYPDQGQQRFYGMDRQIPPNPAIALSSVVHLKPIVKCSMKMSSTSISASAL